MEVTPIKHFVEAFVEVAFTGALEAFMEVTSMGAFVKDPVEETSVEASTTSMEASVNNFVEATSI